MIPLMFTLSLIYFYHTNLVKEKGLLSFILFGVAARFFYFNCDTIDIFTVCLLFYIICSVSMWIIYLTLSLSHMLFSPLTLLT